MVRLGELRPSGMLYLVTFKIKLNLDAKTQKTHVRVFSRIKLKLFNKKTCVFIDLKALEAPLLIA